MENTSAPQKGDVSVDDSGFKSLQNKQAKTVDPTDTTNAIEKDQTRQEYIGQFKSYFPKFAGYNTNYLVNMLNTNENWRKAFAKKLKESNPAYQSFLQSHKDEPNVEKGYDNLLLNNLQSVLHHVSYDGKKALHTITDHFGNLSLKLPNQYRISNAASLIEKNKSQFKNYGFDFDKPLDPDQVENKYKHDKAFRDQLIKAKLSEFQKTLSTKANEGVFDAHENPTEYAKAFAIYNKFGSAALTDYTNLIQHYDPKAAIQEPSVTQALNDFKYAPQYKNTDPFQYAGRFVAGRKGIELHTSDAAFKYQKYINDAAEKYGVDPALIAGVVHRESIDTGVKDPTTVTSKKGAVGMMQLLPGTARDMGLRVNDDTDERTNPEKNIDAGTKYLAGLLKEYNGNTKKALAAYNAGPRRVNTVLGKSKNWLKALGRKETSDYVPAVLGYQKQYEKNKTAEIDPLVFTPVKPIASKHKDSNNFTDHFYYTPNFDHQTQQERTVNYVNRLLKAQGWKQGLDLSGMANQSKTLNLVMKDAKENVEPAPLSRLFEYSKKIHPKDGLPSYSEFAYNTVDMAARAGHLGDVIKTVIANAKYDGKNDHGYPMFSFDYHDLRGPGKQYQKILVDGLLNSPYGDRIIWRKGNTITIEPEAAEDFNARKANFYTKKKHLTFDKNGLPTGVKETIPFTLGNTIRAAIEGVGNVGAEVGGGVVGKWGKDILSAIGTDNNNAALQWFESVQNRTRHMYQAEANEQYEPLFKNGSWSVMGLSKWGATMGTYMMLMGTAGRLVGMAGSEALGGTATAEAAEEGNLVAKAIHGTGKGIRFIGRKILGRTAEDWVGTSEATSEEMAQLAAQRKLPAFKNIADLTDGISNSKAVRIAKNIFDRVARGEEPAMIGKFSLGAGALETVFDPHYSMSGLLKVAFDKYQGEHSDVWDPERAYRLTHHFARWASDWFGGELLGVLMDGTVGALKLGKDYLAGVKSGEFRGQRMDLGLEYDGKEYIPKSLGWNKHQLSNYWFPDTQRFLYHISKGTSLIPEGEIRQAAMGYAEHVGPQIYKEGEEATQADIATKFVQESHEFMGTFRDDLETTIRNINKRYGGVITDEQVKGMRDRVYGQFMKKYASVITEFLNQAPEDANRLTPEKFAYMLETHPAVMTEHAVEDDIGRAVFNRADAAKLTQRHPGSVAVDIGNGEWTVMQPEGAEWRFDLAKEIRKANELSGNTFATKIAKHLQMLGIDPTDPEQLDRADKVIDALDATNEVGYRKVIKQENGPDKVINGYVDGYNKQGWIGKNDDGSTTVYHSIRSHDPNIPERPPFIDEIPKPKSEEESTGEGTQKVGNEIYDELGRKVGEETPPEDLRNSQNRKRVLDLRTPDQIMSDIADADHEMRQQAVNKIFGDFGSKSEVVQSIKQDLIDGNIEEADRKVAHLAQLENEGKLHEVAPELKDENGAIRLGGLIDMVDRYKSEYERSKNEGYFYGQDRIKGLDPEIRDALYQQHMDGLKRAIGPKGDTNDAVAHVGILRQLGVSKEEINKVLNGEGYASGERMQNFLLDFNNNTEFPTPRTATDELKTEVNDKRLAEIEKSSKRKKGNVRNQIAERISALVHWNSEDAPQRAITEEEPSVVKKGSWNDSNTEFQKNRPNGSKGKTKMSPRKYSIRLAADLGTDNPLSIAKLQGTSGGSKIPITELDLTEFTENGGIKNGYGKVFRITPENGEPPFYVMGLKRNIKSYPTRFITDQDGHGFVYNQDWAYINPNVTVNLDGTLKRFNLHTDIIPDRVLFVEHPNGEFILNVQNPVEANYWDVVGRSMRNSSNEEIHTVPGKAIESYLPPDEVMHNARDAVEIEHPETGRKMYYLASEEEQAMLNGKRVNTKQDVAPRHVIQSADIEEAKNKPGHVLGKLSKKEGKLNSMAFLAIPGLALTSNIGIDKNGELTPFGKAAMAIGLLGVGGVLIRSMTGDFRIKGAYDDLEPKYRNVFDQFDWRNKVDENGKPIADQLTDDEHAMFNRLQGKVPKEDYKMMRDYAHQNNVFVSHDSRSQEMRETQNEIIRLEHKMENFKREGNIREWYNAEVKQTEYKRKLNSLIETTPSKTNTASKNIQADVGEGQNADVTFNKFTTKFIRNDNGDLINVNSKNDKMQPSHLIYLNLTGEEGLNVNSTPPQHEFDVYPFKKPVNPEDAWDTAFKIREQKILENPVKENIGSPIETVLPVVWARLNKAQPEGLILDELQLDNRLQIGSTLGNIGNINKDLYATVLDDVMKNATKDHDGNVYITSGSFQKDRYSIPEEKLQELEQQGHDTSEHREFMASKGLESFYDQQLPSMIKKRYGVNVELADPNSSDPLKANFNRLHISGDQVDKVYGKTMKRVQWSSIPMAPALAALGVTAYGLSNISSKPNTNQDPKYKEAGMGGIEMVLLGALALGALNAGGVRTRLGNKMRGMIDEGLMSAEENGARSSSRALEYDGIKFENRELYERQIAHNPTDPADIKWTHKWLRRVHKMISGGKSVFDAVHESPKTQAWSQALTSIADGIRTKTGFRGTTIADKIRDWIISANWTPSKVLAKVYTHFNDEMGYGARAFTQFQQEEGPALLKSIFAGDMREGETRTMFGDSVNRLLHRGIVPTGDGSYAVRREIPENVGAIYNEPKYGAAMEKMDQELLRNKKFADYVYSYQQAYEDMNNRILKSLNTKIGRDYQRLDNLPMSPTKYQIKIGGEKVKTYSHDDLMNLVDDWTNNNPTMSYNQYMKTLEPEDRHLFRVARRYSKAFRDMVESQNNRSRYTELRGHYHPQMVDHVKLKLRRQYFIEKAEKAGIQDPEKYAMRQLQQEFAQVNRHGDGRGLLGYDEDKMSMQSHTFKTLDGAYNRLIGSVLPGQPSEIQDAFHHYIGDRVTTDNLLKKGFIQEVTDENGNTNYILRQPEDFTPQHEGHQFNIYDLDNANAFNKWYNTILYDPMVRRSRFIENPRRFNYPQSWALTDPFEAWKKYSTDTGYRLHAMEGGIYDPEDFTNEYVKPLASVMRNLGYEDDYIQKISTRVDNMYRNQWGIMSNLAGKTSEEIDQALEKQRKTAAALSVYRNVEYAKRALGFKYLDWFQPWISTMPITSYRATKAAYGIGAEGYDYGALRSMEEILMDHVVLKDKDLSFRADQQMLDPMAKHDTALGYMQRGSTDLAYKIGNWSPEKMLLKLVGIDPASNGRAVRLVTDSMHGVNVMNTGQNALAFLDEASHYAKIAKEMQDGGFWEDESRGLYRAKDGKLYNKTEVYRKLENLGVSRTGSVNTFDAEGNLNRMNSADYFIQNEHNLRDFLGKLRNHEKVTLNDFEAPYADQLENIMHFATETYYGTNQAMRPDAWNSQLGRTLAMYANFSYNVGMQVTKHRILDPIDRWLDRYATDEEGVRQIGRIRVPLLFRHIRKGDTEALARLGVRDPARAIGEFPIDAIDTMYRGMAGVGLSVAAYTTLDIMRDLYGAPVNAYFGNEQFKRTKDAFGKVINPYAPKSKQVTFNQLFGGDADSEDMMRFLGWAGARLSQSGYLGMYASPFESMVKYGYEGPADMIPAYGILDRDMQDIYNMGKNIGLLNFKELPSSMAKFGIDMMPVLNANVNLENRQAITKKINDWNKSIRKQEKQNNNQ